TNGGTSWTTITGTLPVGSGQITYLDISDTDPNKVWVTFSGYSAANKVFQTVNGGTSWTNISAGLPNVPTNCVVYEPGSSVDAIYIGNDIGVYYRDNTTSGWVNFDMGLPNVVILELEVFAPGTAGARLRAASYGRGLWESDLYGEDCQADLILSGNVTGTQDFEATNTITSTHNLVLPANITYSAVTRITLNPGFNVPLGAVFSAVMNGCSSPKMADATSGTYEWIDLRAEEDPLGIGSLGDFAVTTFPNPFQGLAHIAYNLPSEMNVRVEVYDASLKRVAILVNGMPQGKGTHTVDFQADNLAGAVYFVKITAGDRQSVHKIIKNP
ncbi:MAG TPA: T9SS type A sorting domain-containing protein, partial [Bacteroidetes bacterium]|nr:T9SS type A sorting domain-containing protein [Bacteroidota bacterium]